MAVASKDGSQNTSRRSLDPLPEEDEIIGTVEVLYEKMTAL